MKRLICSILMISFITMLAVSLYGCNNSSDASSSDGTLTEDREKLTEDDLKEKYGNIKVGDIIKFGKNENGADIEWLVYKRDATDADIVSISTITHKAADLYDNDMYVSTTLYSWLDTEFEDECFTYAEKEIIGYSSTKLLTDMDYALYILKNYNDYYTEPFWIRTDSNKWKSEHYDSMALWFPDNSIFISTKSYSYDLFWCVQCYSSVSHDEILNKNDQRLSDEEKEFINHTSSERLNEVHNVVVAMTLSGLKSPS